MYMPQLGFGVFRSKGEVYRHLNSSCIKITHLNSHEAIENLRNGVEAFVEKIGDIIQCIITVKNCRYGTSIAVVFDGRKKIFYSILDALYIGSDIDGTVDSILGFLSRGKYIDCLKEVKAIYNFAGETVKIRFRCQFDLDALKAVILNAIFLSFFFASIQNLRA